ncbi:hypothetical protein GF336_07120 [Candidatus Woesearchaeota archaeon]|nr:hypothetical protein [Candidatus Woesearchaeota archaeon]
MSLLTTIIILAVIIIIGLIIFKVTKAVAKTIFYTTTIIGIAGLVFAFLIYQDASDFRENFPTKPSMLLLESEEQILAGIEGRFSEASEPTLIGYDQLQDIKTGYKEDNMDTVRGDNYKVFIFSLNSFEAGSIDIGEDTLSKEQAETLLLSDSPIDDYADIVLKDQDDGYKEQFKQQLKKNIKDGAEFKAILFSSLFSEQTEKTGSLFILDEYSKGNIEIYPETIIFKLMKRVPSSILSRLVKTKEV